MDQSTAKAIKPFDLILREITGGRLVAELTDEMTDVIAAVKATGKVGKLSLTLSLHPGGPNNEQVEVRSSIKGSKPELARPISFFFINADNGLQREDPTQNVLPGIQGVVEARNQATGAQKS